MILLWAKAAPALATISEAECNLKLYRKCFLPLNETDSSDKALAAESGTCASASPPKVH